MINIVLKGNPISTNALYKPRANGIYMTRDGHNLKQVYQWEAKKQWRFPPLVGDLAVSVWLFFGDNKRRDWDNWHKISMDSLTGICWNDDSQIQQATVRKKVDTENPRIEIYIENI
jgi:Holliday junction resolvase RusA-like endonuclease